MQTVAKNNLNLTEFSSFKGLTRLHITKSHELYQQFILGLFKGNEAQVYYLLDKLSALAHYAYTLRRMDIIEEVSRVLLNLPISDQRKNVGRYYQAMCLKYEGKISESKSLLERVAADGPLRYRARAIQYLGAIAHAAGEYQEALSLYIDASRIAMSNNWCDPYTTVTASQNIAIVKSMNGDHKGALAGLERLFPLVKTLGRFEPYKYHHYLNSYAVELGEVGRLEEARNVSRIVIASPFAPVYPEWQQTAADLQAHSRSMVQVSGSRNVLAMPPAPNRVVESPPTRPAKIFSLAEWKKKMVKQPNDEPDENVDVMDRKDLLVKLLELAAQEDTDEEELRKVVKYAVEVMTKR